MVALLAVTAVFNFILSSTDIIKEDSSIVNASNYFAQYRNEITLPLHTCLTDEQVEEEIARLTKSPFVKLARKQERIKYQRRQYLYGLRDLENRGKKLFDAGITLDVLECVDNECEEYED